MSRAKYFNLSFLLLFFLVSVRCSKEHQPVFSGLDVLIGERQDIIRGKRIGIVTNQTAITKDKQHIVDALVTLPRVNIKALFAPEHGIRGDREGGEYIESYVDSLTGIKVYSLYGKSRKPSSAMLDSIDVLLFDIQDIGARFYTYISTMGLAMEAAAEKGIPFVVLDRPNPITGVIMEGPVLQPSVKSFVGRYPIPIRHGMTVGELARMINGEGWLKNEVHADLTVVPVKNWHRLQWFDQTGLPWVKTSPNMPNLESATLYPGIGLLEGINISEGRGTDEPFVKIGAPWLEPEKIAQELSGIWIYGVKLQPIRFFPVSMPNATLHPEYENEQCRGFRINIYDRNVFRAVSFAVYLICAVEKLYPDQILFTRGFDRLAGNVELKRQILDGMPAKKIIAGWENEIENFKQLREKYLLYK